nr:hypothetical transcript [Hymenolepis microstoma]
MGMRSSFSYSVKAFSSTDERIVMFPVTRAITPMGVDFIPPLIRRHLLEWFGNHFRWSNEWLAAIEHYWLNKHLEVTQEFECALTIILVVDIWDEAVEWSSVQQCFKGHLAVFSAPQGF